MRKSFVALLIGLILGSVFSAYADMGAGSVRILTSSNQQITLGSKTSTNSLPVVVASDQAAIPVTIGANSSVNVAQFGGTNVVTGTGASGAGIPRVTLSNDSSLAANQSVNLGQIGGATYALGQAVMASSAPVVIASNQSNVPVVQQGYTAIVTGQQAVTSTAAALPSNAGKKTCLKVLASGTQTVYIGPSGVTTSTGQELMPGDSWCEYISNSNIIFVIAGSTGSTVAFSVLN